MPPLTERASSVADKATFTPGPWEKGSTFKGAVFGSDGHLVANATAYARGASAAEANAHLIAAAPELFEALVWAEAALAPFSKEPAEKSGINKVRAALAKARGQ